MNSFTDTVKGIDIKARQLALKYHTLKSQMQTSEQRLTETENLVNTLKQTIQTLENKDHIHTLAKSINTGKDPQQVKKKINELLREVDHCIDLLNHQNR